MRKDRLATLTMDIVVNHPTKRTALDAVYVEAQSLGSDRVGPRP